MLRNQICSEGEGFGTSGNDARRDRTEKEQKVNHGCSLRPQKNTLGNPSEGGEGECERTTITTPLPLPLPLLLPHPRTTTPRGPHRRLLHCLESPRCPNCSADAPHITLKSDRLGVGPKAKTEGPYRFSVKLVTSDASALAARLKVAEDMRRT